MTESVYAEKLSGFSVRLTDCEICGVETPASERKHIPNPDKPAYVLYTSGTTGRPKGVCVTNRNVCHYVRAFENEFHPTTGDIMLQYSVCSFDIFVEEVFTSLLNGAALAIPTDEDKDADEDGLSYMTAYIVPSAQDMKVSEIRKELSENLAAFMIPEFIVKMPQIPLNSNGKPDTARLPVVMKAGA